VCCEDARSTEASGYCRGGIPKPAFNALPLLHQLGEEAVPRRRRGRAADAPGDGALVLAIWNYTEIGCDREGAKRWY